MVGPGKKLDSFYIKTKNCFAYKTVKLTKDFD